MWSAGFITINLLIIGIEAIAASSYTQQCVGEMQAPTTRTPQTKTHFGIIGAFIFPHGGITLDPKTRNFSGSPAVKRDSKENCIRLHDAMQRQADLLVSKEPELIILSTPHGLQLGNSYLFLGNKKVSGTVQKLGPYRKKKKYTAQFNIETTLSNFLMKKLAQLNNPVEKLRIGCVNDTLPLRWGEVIPWYFINEAAKRANFTLPPVIFIGQAPKQPIIPELIKLGNDMQEIISENPQLNNKKIAFVTSSDLSHAHSNASTSPYPFDPSSTKFDGFVNDWAQMNYNVENLSQAKDTLTIKAGNVFDSALSCGYTGLVMLHGVLESAVLSGSKFKATLMDYSAPTYFGMMVNHWLRV